MPSILGIDSGLTVTKAVVFDESGTPLSVARRRLPQSIPRPRHIERDMDGLWRAAAEAVAEAVATCGRPASDIRSVAATAHGDGVYLLDRQQRPLGPGILSLDSRASAPLAAWVADGTAERALALTGQRPHVSAPSALLAWVRDEEPERYAQIGHVLACKDWLRACLTGRVGTDRTEASTSFTDVRRQEWSAEALRLYGLGALEGALPPIAGSAEMVGEVTPEAAALTGLRPGTPVAAGLHDVTASSLGIGGHREGVVAVVAGTYSINEVVAARPLTDRRWFCRAAVAPGLWHAMSISPASTANYDWFLDHLCAAERAVAGAAIHDHLAPEIEAAFARPSSVLFHPYLYGSPHGEQASAGFLGLQGWHHRGDMLRAVLEGIAFNHRVHVEALREGFAFDSCRLTGGASRSPLVAQLFADVLGLPVTVTATEEAAAWGAALCAGAAVGLYPRFDADPRDMAALVTTYEADSTRQAWLEDRFALHCRISEALAPLWPAIGALGA